VLLCRFSWEKGLRSVESGASIEIHREGVNELQPLETSVENVTRYAIVSSNVAGASHAPFDARLAANIRGPNIGPLAATA
jgi:hypothetical protein